MADIAHNRLKFAKDNGFADAILLLEPKKSQNLEEALLIALGLGLANNNTVATLARVIIGTVVRNGGIEYHTGSIG